MRQGHEEIAHAGGIEGRGDAVGAQAIGVSFDHGGGTRAGASAASAA